MVNQEKKDIEARQQKRQEALMPKHQPTPIPEESASEAIAEKVSKK